MSKRQHSSSASSSEEKKQDEKRVEQQKAETASVDWQKQAAEYLAGWQRAKADYLNLKKEMEEKIAQLSVLAKGKVLLDFLPIYNNLLAAFDHIPEKYRQEGWAEGFAHIKSQLEKFLVDQGLERIETVGQKFDPQVYEAIETVSLADKEEGEIVQEISPGYRLNGQILIHPKVVVNSRQSEINKEKDNKAEKKDNHRQDENSNN